MQYKLGRKPTKFDVGTPSFGDYLSVKLPATPLTYDWTKNITTWPMMLNDKEGDCTIVGAAHLEEVYSAYGGGKLVIIPDASVQSAYIAVTKAEGAAYNPVTGANDNGCAMLDVVKYWRSTGIGGHKISAYAKINIKNLDHMRLATYMFGGVYIGLNLPIGSQPDGSDIFNKDWVLPAHFHPTGNWAPGSLGGHAVCIVAYDATSFEVITWGGKRKMSTGFWQYYGGEAYIALSPEWTVHGKSPSGFLLSDLQADMPAVAA